MKPIDKSKKSNKMARAGIITVAKNAADAWRGTDTYHQAAQIIDMLVSELEEKPTLTPQNETPPCYQPDGDGCAYQCYDGQDEPIDKCKECPLCYSDKQRQHTPPNELLPVLVNDEPDQEYIDYICPRCKDTISQRRRGQRMETVYQCKYHDNCGQRVDWSNPQPYRRPTEGEA